MSITGWTKRPPAPAVEMGAKSVVCEGLTPPVPVGLAETDEVVLMVGMTKEPMLEGTTVAGSVLVELGSGNEAQVVEVEVVVSVWPGQLVAVGLHSVMVTVLVMVWVDVVVMSISSAETMATAAATMAKMLLNCILSGW